MATVFVDNDDCGEEDNDGNNDNDGDGDNDDGDGKMIVMRKLKRRNSNAKLLPTNGSDAVRQLVPVHQVGMSISPDTPPSGAPW